MPYFARGPSAKIIREATKIWDVPNIIKSIIANGCQDCKNRRHDVSPPPVAQLKIVPHNLANLKRPLRDTVKKSVSKFCEIKDNIYISHNIYFFPLYITYVWLITIYNIWLTTIYEMVTTNFFFKRIYIYSYKKIL